MPLFNPSDPRHYWDSRYGFHIEEDWITAGITQIGGLIGFSFGGTGSTPTNWPAGTALPTGWFGAVRTTTGTTTTGNVGGGCLSPIPLGLGATWYETRIRIPVLSDATDTYYERDGYLDLTTTESVDAVAFRYTHSVNGGRWEAYTRNNSVETAQDTGITVAANTDYILRIEINAAATQALFYINGTLTNTITTNIPSGLTRFTGMGFSLVKSAGTTARSVDRDYIRLDYIYTTPRT